MPTIVKDLDEVLKGKTIIQTRFEPCRIILYLDNGDVIDLNAKNQKDDMKLYTDLNVKTLLSGLNYNI